MGLRNIKALKSKGFCIAWASQHSVPGIHRDNVPEPRQTTPGLAWWDASRRVFGQFLWLEADSVKVALSRPAHQPPAGTATLWRARQVPREDHTGQAASR